MIPLARYASWPDTLDAHARTYLAEDELKAYLAIPEPERLEQLKALLEEPIARFTSVNDVFFRARWADVLRRVHPARGAVLLEIASGDADMIPQVMAREDPHSRYITANANRLLTASLRGKVKDLPLEIEVIEDDAAAIDRHLAAESVDVVAFQHGVNDVLQAILCDREGVDTIESDWMDTLPTMIDIVRREIDQNTFEAHVRPPFLALLQTLLAVLNRGGVVVMNHYMFQLDLDWGYPPALWEDLIPIVRKWVRALPEVREITFEGFDQQWWLFLAKG